MPSLNLKGGQRGVERNEIHIPEMHKDLFSLTLTLSYQEAAAPWLGMKGRYLLHPIPCLRVFALVSHVHAKWRMPQLRMAAFDLQRVAQLPAGLLQEGGRPTLFLWGTGDQPLLLLATGGQEDGRNGSW